MQFKQDAVIVEPYEEHKVSVIWLHGLGADGNDFKPIIPELNLPRNLGIRFIFPHAPIRPITVNNNMPMRAWYDINSLNLLEREDSNSIISATSLVHKYIDHEINSGINSNKIILAGFSQGGAVTLYAGLRYLSTLGGLLALSSYLPLADDLAKNTITNNKTTPIVMMHGLSDPVIPVEQGYQSYEKLNKHGYNIKWHEFNMPHTTCSEEIKIISDWFIELLT